ncbi:MAG: metallophosphoesterase family protein [Candidatus Desulforudis sp.]|nr:metallophosphoesterase family protein [Desulforudis sp.]
MQARAAAILGKLSGPKWRLLLVELVAVVVGAALCVVAFGPGVYEVQGLHFRGELRPVLSGRTVLEIPPLGSLIADTHRGPVELHITLQGIRPDVLAENLYPQVDPDLFRDLESESQSPVLAFIAKQIALGGLGAVVLFWALARPPWKRLCRAGVLGAVFVGLVLASSVHTYDRGAFQEPEYRGVIAAAPRVMHMADEMLTKLQDFQDKTDLLVHNIKTLFGQAERLTLLGATEEESTRRVLIIADIHNNPFALDFIESLVHHFRVDMILDAGDFTDFGSPIEAQAAAKISGFGVPYVFAPGNHDSPEVVRFMREVPNVRVLNGQVVDVRGIRILGSPDPWAHGETVVAATKEEEQWRLDGQIDRLRASLVEAEAGPDILMAHHPAVVQHFAGEAPILISGHTHRVLLEQLGDSWHLNPGSTGSAGLRGLQTTSEVPYSAIIMHFNGADQTVIAADIIKYNALSGSFTVERRLMGSPAQEYIPESTHPVHPS